MTDMKIRHFRLEVQPTLGPPIDGLVRGPIAGAGTQIMEVRLEKGFKVPRHNHPEEQWSYMITGRLQFWADEEPESPFGNAPLAHPHRPTPPPDHPDW
jgi:quercetin dioxygenase-like cupin family protein